MPTVDELLVVIDATTEQLRREMRRAERSVGQAENRINRSLTKIDRGFESLTRSARGAGVALGLAAGGVALQRGLRGYVQMADTARSLESQLKLVTDSSEELAAVQDRLFEITQESRQGLEQTTNLYARLARSTDQLGISEERLLGVTESINRAVALSATTTEGARAALFQLGQGIAAGALRGEELNSVLEQTPRVAQALADGLGVGIAQLRAMGSAGELTAEKVIAALEDQADTINREFGDVERRVSDALTQLRSQMVLTVGEVDEGTGATNDLIEAIDKLREAVGSDEFKTVLEGAASLFAAMAETAATTVKELAALENAVRSIGDFFSGMDTLAELGRQRQEILDALADPIRAGSPALLTELAAIEEQIRAITAAGSEVPELNLTRLLGGEGESETPSTGGGGGGGSTSGKKDRTFADVLADINEQARELESRRITEIFEEGRAVFADTRTEAELYAAELERLGELLAADAINQDTYNRAVANLNEEMAESKDQTDELRDSLSRFGDLASSAFEDAIIGGEGLRSVLAGLAEDLARLAIRSSLNSVLDRAATGISGSGFLSGLFGGFFEDGGRPPLGKVSVVGEGGPELFVPDSAGTIVPNGGFGGMTYAPVISVDARNSTLGRGEITAIVQTAVNQSVATVRNMQNRTASARI